MGLGHPSPWIEVQTGHLDRTWHLVLELFETTPKGLEGPVRTFTDIQARSSQPPGQPWMPLIANRTKSISLLCLGYNNRCLKNLLFWQNDPRYDQYRVQVRFEHDPDLAVYIGDVGFESVVTPDKYARIALGFKHAYGIVALVLTVFWFAYMLLFKKWAYSTWNWEQRYLTVLLVGLNIYNNPIYGVQLATVSGFFPWWNAFCEIFYVGIALALWLTHIARFRRAVLYENYILDKQEWTSTPHDIPQEVSGDHQSNSINYNGSEYNRVADGDDDEVSRSTTSAYYDSPAAPVPTDPVLDNDPIFDRRSIVYIALSAAYVFLTSGLFLWSALRDRMTPVTGLGSSSTSFQLVYYLAAAFYTMLVILLTVQLSFNALGTRRHKDLLWGRYVFFAGPTVLLAFSLVLGLFTSNVGPYGSNMVGVLCYSALFNGYVYFMLWAYWPVDGGYDPKDASESASIFSESAPSYASHL
jgi:hypothetical protein